MNTLRIGSLMGMAAALSPDWLGSLVGEHYKQKQYTKPHSNALKHKRAIAKKSRLFNLRNA